MNKVIQQKIESVEVIDQRMNDTVSQTISLILHESEQFADIPNSDNSRNNTNSSARSLSTIGLVSGGAFLVGSVGWLIYGSLWTKVLFWGGGIGLVSEFFFIKGSKSNVKSRKEKYQKSPSISALKQSASQKIISVIEKVSNLWENLANSNKEQLLVLIEQSPLSSNDKFNASSYVSVTKTLDFELLKIQNLIDSASSITEFNSNISNIHNVLKSKINTVSRLQIDSYRQVDEILSRAN